MDAAKTTYRDQWNVSADAWDRWWHVLERGMGPINAELVAEARIEPGDRVLDVACGLGEPAFTAARRVGEQGHVHAVDLAPRMIELATQRACERGVAHVEFVTGDAEDLRVPASSFDAAVSRFGLMLLPRPELGARNLLRALKPGRRAAVSVWAGPEHVPFIALPQQLAERLGLAPPLDLDAPGPLRMGRAGQLESCLAAAGFEDVAVRSFAVTMDYTSVQEFLDFQRGMHGTLKRALEAADPATAAHGWSELERAIQPFVTADGRVRFPCRTWIGVGRAPLARDGANPGIRA